MGIRSPAPRFRHVWGGVSQHVFVLDSMRVWTAEEGGRIRRTIDGGANWEFQTTPNEIDGLVRAVRFLRQGLLAGQSGWAVGSNGRLIATSNGGQSWSLVGAPLLYPADDPRAGQPVDLWDVFFKDALNGWVAGIRVLRRTLDGGQSWIDLLPLNPNLPSSVEFYRLAFIGETPNQVGVAVAEPGLIARSEDGTTWSTAMIVPKFCPNLKEDIELWDVQFQPAESPATARGYAVGGQGNLCGGMLSSSDGGATWVVETCAAQPPTVYSVTPLTGDGAIACSYGGLAFARLPNVDPEWTDISATLDPPRPSLRVPMWSAGSDGGPNVWIAGVMNTVYKSSDGGALWVKQRGEGAWRMRDIHFLDPSSGWAVAEELTVLRTQDAGTTWIEELAVSGPTLNAVRFRDAAHGVVVGNPYPGGAPVIFYRDAAQTPVWIPSNIAAPPVPPPSNAALRSATWAAPFVNEAWAVGTKGVVMRSVDGIGQDWSYFPSPPSSSAVEFLSITFDGGNALYAVGVNRATGEACAYRLRYPALSWENLSPSLSGTWRAVAARGTEVYVAGTNAAGGGEVHKLDPSSTPGAPVWNLVLPAPGAPVPQPLWSAALVERGASQTLFVGGERGSVLRFQGGAWSAPKSQTSVTLTALSFLSQARGFAAGHGSVDGVGVGGGGLGDSALVGYA